MTMTKEERNGHYGKLNARFDERAAVLRGLGFKYEPLPVLNVAVFTRVRFGKPMTIAASYVLCADEIVWEDKLEEATRFCK